MRVRRTDPGVRTGRADQRGAGHPARLGRALRHVAGLSWVLLVIGLLVAAVAGSEWAGTVQSQEQRATDVQAGAIENRLAEALGASADLAHAVGALLSVDPQLTNGQFDRWFQSEGTAAERTDVVALAYTQAVPVGQLAGFAARDVADPPFGLHVGTFALTPPGARSRYCLLSLGLLHLPPLPASRSAAVSQALGAFMGFIDPGNDQCDGPAAPLLAAAASSGHAVTGPLSQLLGLLGAEQQAASKAIGQLFGGLAPFFELRAVYDTATPPATVAARQAEVRGWVITVLDARELLQPVVASQSGVAVDLSYQPESGPPVLLERAGRPRPGSMERTLAFDAGGRWLAEVWVPASEDLTPTEQGVAVGGGIALFVLLLVFSIRVLAVARAQAVALAERATGALQHQARHDSLTGLANRSEVLATVDSLLAAGRDAGGADGSLALVVCDLDGFKDLNDAYGHHVGDQLLREAGDRLLEVGGPAALVGRIGGDEFALVVEGEELPDPGQLAAAVQAALALPFRLADVPGPVGVTASVGVATGLRASARDLLRDADIALAEAKAEGPARAVVFRPEMRAAVVRRFDLESELRQALRHGQFFLVYQPTFDLEGLGVTGVEALLRWRHPTRGIVPPMEFVPTLEHSGLIVDVGRWVLLEACRQVQQWHAQGYPVSVAVNVSGRQLEGDEIVRDVRAALVRSGLDPRALVVEITETVLMRDPLSIAARLRDLKALGIRVAVDDFGTGYSSMAYLQQFPVDILKIDRSFVTGMVESPEGAALVRALVQLGKALGLVTLAEGIEDELQLYRLRAEHCDAGQGYLFARPLPPDEAVRFMAERAAQLASRGPEAPSGSAPTGPMA
ncbi:putative bifunctional diguanylate cyclase/phosphodiesterase [Aciditerrimonas ferrireducens]|uniref:Bifunctional diguanylate cyclase/phosphodiesterase n=1 Tax=Aciditerrimonas ferrireducens TaxID=667306 RepID=A0ABV6C2Z5_9ACTN